MITIKTFAGEGNTAEQAAESAESRCNLFLQNSGHVLIPAQIMGLRQQTLASQETDESNGQRFTWYSSIITLAYVESTTEQEFDYDRQ